MELWGFWREKINNKKRYGEMTTWKTRNVKKWYWKKIEEKEKEATSIINLIFLRHSIKDSDPNAQDEDINISKEGFNLIDNKRKNINFSNKDLIKTYRSDRIRTGQTGTYLLNPEFTNLYGFDGGELNIIDNRLNFLLDDNTKTTEEAMKAYEEGKYLEWLVKNSDDSAIVNGDLEQNSTYTKLAANISSLILDSLYKSDKWDEKVKKSKEKGEEIDKTLDEILTSHQGVLESFLSKVIEKVDGVITRDEFINALEKKGFSETEGFEVRIFNNNGKKDLYIEFLKKNNDGDDIFQFKRIIDIDVLKSFIDDYKSLKDNIIQ